MWAIRELSAPPSPEERAGLVALLRDSVNGGASVGFLAPLAEAEANDYWTGVAADVARESRMLLIAQAGATVAGSVQLELAMKPNARHRAEVQKLLVHRSARRRGLGRALMAAIEEAARKRGRHLLVLDTRLGDAAERLYEQIGYHRAGVIPGFALGSGGMLDATVIFYKKVPNAAG